MIISKETLQSYLNDYLNKKPHTEGQIAQKTSVKDDTVLDWYKKVSFPKGLELLKLKYFLFLNGYEIDIDSIDYLIFLLGYLIYCDKINLKEISDKLGYPDTSEMLRVLHGNRGLSITRKYLLKNELSGFNIDEIKDLISKERGGKSEDDDVFIEMIKAMTSISTVLVKKLELLNRKDYKPKRIVIREKSGKIIFEASNVISRLNSLLKALCSETSRENNLEEAD